MFGGKIIHYSYKKYVHVHRTTVGSQQCLWFVYIASLHNLKILLWDKALAKAELEPDLIIASIGIHSHIQVKCVYKHVYLYRAIYYINY